MPAIYHDLTVLATPAAVFKAISTPDGLDAWWTAQSAGTPHEGNVYSFWFAPEYDWRGKVISCVLDKQITWTITEADADWTGTQLSFELIEKDQHTLVRFSHTNWRTVNDHFRRTSYCWAIYLHGLKKFVEEDLIRPFESRANI